MSPLERIIDILADAHEELAADNAAAAIREHRIDLALVDEPIAPPRTPYAGWAPGATPCDHVVVINEFCTRCGRNLPD